MVGRTVPIGRNHHNRKHQRRIGIDPSLVLGTLQRGTVTVGRRKDGLRRFPEFHPDDRMVETLHIGRIRSAGIHGDRIVTVRRAVNIILSGRILYIRIENETVHKTSHVIHADRRIRFYGSRILAQTQRPAVNVGPHRIFDRLAPLVISEILHQLVFGNHRIGDNFEQFHIHNDRRAPGNGSDLAFVARTERRPRSPVRQSVSNIGTDDVPRIHLAERVQHAALKLEIFGHVMRIILKSALQLRRSAVARNEYISRIEDPPRIVYPYPVAFLRMPDHVTGQGIQLFSINTRRLFDGSVAVIFHPFLEGELLPAPQIVGRLFRAGSD